MKQFFRTLNVILRIFQAIAAGQYFHWMFITDKMASIDIKYCIAFIVAVYACLHTLYTIYAYLDNKPMPTLLGFTASSFGEAARDSYKNNGTGSDYYRGRLDGTQKELIKDVCREMNKHR